jgi:hypothetical protein
MRARQKALKRKLDVAKLQQQQQKRNSITSAPSSAPVGRSSPSSQQGIAR